MPRASRRREALVVVDRHRNPTPVVSDEDRRAAEIRRRIEDLLEAAHLAREAAADRLHFRERGPAA